jgi:hypothetical protein
MRRRWEWIAITVSAALLCATAGTYVYLLVSVNALYNTGPLVDANGHLWGTRRDVLRRLGKPRNDWSRPEAEANGYPWEGWGGAPPKKFSRVLLYFDKDQLLYVYLDEHDRVAGTYLARS